MFAGLSGDMNPPGATWSYVERLKKMTRMKLVLKGIDTAEDAKLAREYAADGVIVSNHGGRSTETGRGTIDILPEVVDAEGPQFPVFVDGGFRRGSDVYKPLAIGARRGQRPALNLRPLGIRAGGYGASARHLPCRTDPHHAAVWDTIDGAGWQSIDSQVRNAALNIDPASCCSVCKSTLTVCRHLGLLPGRWFRTQRSEQ